MRSAVAIALILGTLTISSGSASAVPLALGDHATLSREASVAVMQVAHRHYYTRHAKRDDTCAAEDGRQVGRERL